jgi:quercetin dioxygenase-like cupin family protein
MKPKLIKKSQTATRDFGDGLKLQILIDSLLGTKNLDMGTVVIPPNGATKMHVRDFEEVIYMLSGQGELVTDDGQAFTLDAGDCVLIPAGTTHLHANRTDEPLEQLYIFAPQAAADVEKSLRDLAIL